MINLKTEYGKKYKVTWEESWEAGDDRPDEEFLEIKGKRGYIRPWGATELELYIENTIVANRIEREMPHFKPKNHYDNGAAFTFDPIHLPKAVRLILGRKRRTLSPEQQKLMVERLARMRRKPKNVPINHITED